jgi:uncharacterized membrane protein HdeD (DUF308 family)
MRNRTASILKSALILLFGILVLAEPSTALVMVTTYFGILAIAGGAISIFFAYRHYQRGLIANVGFLEGFLSLIIGILIIVYPEVTVSFFMVVFGFWAAFIGITQIMAYLRIEHTGLKNGLLLFAGILSLLVGIVLIFRPFESAGILAVIIGVYAIIYSISHLATHLFQRR